MFSFCLKIILPTNFIYRNIIQSKIPEWNRIHQGKANLIAVVFISFVGTCKRGEKNLKLLFKPELLKILAVSYKYKAYK